MTPSNLTALLSRTIPAGLPTITDGPPGSGKTAIHQQAAAASGRDLVTIYPALHDPTDLGGMPIPTTTDGKPTLVRYVDDLLSTIFDAKKPMLVLLDELGQAPPAMQAACAPLLLARKIGRYVVPDCVTFAACTNRREDRAGASNILTHLTSRFATRLRLEPDPIDWLARAALDGIAWEVQSHIKTSPSQLMDFDGATHY